MNLQADVANLPASQELTGDIDMLSSSLRACQIGSTETDYALENGNLRTSWAANAIGPIRNLERLFDRLEGSGTGK